MAAGATPIPMPELDRLEREIEATLIARGWRREGRWLLLPGAPSEAA